jgi:phospholipid transport system substrate-binding protein
MPAVFRSAFLILSLGAAGLISLPAHAQDDAPSAAAASSATAAVRTHEEAMKTPAGKFVQDLGDRAIGVIADKNLNPDQRSDQFRKILTDSFDLMTIARFVIGRTWNTATPEQQEEYMHLFTELVVKTYGDKLTLYTGEGFSVNGERPDENGKDFIVNSQITHPDGSEPTKIDWRLRLRNGKLGVIDVMVEGVSLSVTQRQEYASIIQNNDGQIDALLKLMKQQLEAPPAQNTSG